MGSFYGSPWADVGDAGASALGAMPSAFLRMQLLKQQIGEAQSRQRLYGAETEYQQARTASEKQLYEQGLQDAIRKASESESFGNAFRRLMANSPAAPGPSLEAARNLQIGDIGAAIPGISKTSNPSELADMVTKLTTLSSSGAMGDPTRALMFEGKKDPFVSGSGGWANLLTGQTGVIPQGPVDAVEAAYKKSQTDLNNARAKAAGKEDGTDKTLLSGMLRAYVEDYKLNEDPDKAEEAMSAFSKAFLEVTAKKPKEDDAGTNAPSLTPPPDTSTNAPSGPTTKKKVRRYNPATDSFE